MNICNKWQDNIVDDAYETDSIWNDWSSSERKHLPSTSNNE